MQQIFFFFLEEDQSIKSGSKRKRERKKERETKRTDSRTIVHNACESEIHSHEPWRAREREKYFVM